MKKSKYLIVIVILCSNFLACSPEPLSELTSEVYTTVGEDDTKTGGDVDED